MKMSRGDLKVIIRQILNKNKKSFIKVKLI